MTASRNFRSVIQCAKRSLWVVAILVMNHGAFYADDTARESTSESITPVGKLQVQKVLFLGNSITLHGPAPQIGWTGNWGMAASAEDKDYVHLVMQQIVHSTAEKPKVMVKNIADFERGLDEYKLSEGLQPELAFEADLVIVAIGENVAALTTDEAQARYQKSFATLLAELRKHGHPKLFVRSCFWADPAKDEIMRAECQAAGGVFVDMSQLGSNEANFARSERQIEHAGVAGHPGDKGMQAIADELWKAIQKEPTLWKP